MRTEPQLPLLVTRPREPRPNHAANLYKDTMTALGSLIQLFWSLVLLVFLVVIAAQILS